MNTKEHIGMQNTEYGSEFAVWGMLFNRGNMNIF